MAGGTSHQVGLPSAEGGRPRRLSLLPLRFGAYPDRLNAAKPSQLATVVVVGASVVVVGASVVVVVSSVVVAASVVVVVVGGSVVAVVSGSVVVYRDDLAAARRELKSRGGAIGRPAEQGTLSWENGQFGLVPSGDPPRQYIDGAMAPVDVDEALAAAERDHKFAVDRLTEATAHLDQARAAVTAFDARKRAADGDADDAA